MSRISASNSINDAPDRSSTTTSPTSPRDCPMLVITGPTSLVHLPSINSRCSADSTVVTSPMMTSPVHRRSESGALSDSELDNVSLRSATSRSRTLRVRRKVAASNQMSRLSIESTDSDRTRLSATPHTPLRTSESSPAGKMFLSPQQSNKVGNSRRPTRRVSCKDLGGGQCKGWLMKKKEGIGRSWSKRWFVLSSKSLYYYRTEQDEKAEGVIYLPGFKISPAPELRTKKFAFKAYHSGTTFYFAAERQDDMAKWMNKLGLASLSDLQLGDLVVTAGFWKPDQLRPAKSASHLDHMGRVESKLSEAYCSESEDSLTSERPSQLNSCSNSQEDLTDMFRNIRQADLDLSGANVKDRRSTVLFGGSTQDDKTDNSEYDDKWRQLLSLNRTVKDKQQTLSAIESFLESTPITSQQLNKFIQQHLHIVSSHHTSLPTTDSEQSLIDTSNTADHSEQSLIDTSNTADHSEQSLIDTSNTADHSEQSLIDTSNTADHCNNLSDTRQFTDSGDEIV